MEEHDKIILDNLISIPTLHSIYKYSNIENGFKCLENSTLYFKSPKDFNDPRDCDPKLISVSDTYLNQLARDNGIKGPISIRTYPKQYIGFKLLAAKKLENEFIPNIKITCFSKKHTTAKMWALYSANHTGICIEFDTCELIVCLPEALKLNNAGGFFLHVKYSPTPVKFVCKRLGDTTTLLKWVSSKSKEWEYEDEIRFVIPKWSGNTFIISSKVIKSVYLGTKISIQYEVKVREFCRDNFPMAQIIKMNFSDLQD